MGSIFSCYVSCSRAQWQEMVPGITDQQPSGWWFSSHFLHPARVVNQQPSGYQPGSLTSKLPAACWRSQGCRLTPRPGLSNSSSPPLAQSLSTSTALCGTPYSQTSLSEPLTADDMVNGCLSIFSIQWYSTRTSTVMIWTRLTEMLVWNPFTPLWNVGAYKRTSVLEFFPPTA